MSTKPTEAKTGKYKDRPLADALADPKDIEKVENRPTVDQIEDYHEKHPTLHLTKTVEAQVEAQSAPS